MDKKSLPAFFAWAIERLAAGRNHQRRMRAVRELPDYAIADAGYTRDWRGDLKELPRGCLR